MAQISIPMSNKVGYSMYWNSMWDDKINFNRSLKEDIYLNSFIPLIFDDNISTKILKSVDFNSINKNKIVSQYNLHLKVANLNKNDFFKYISDLNKVNFFKSRVWVLKYQKWVIIYFFIYLPNFNKLKKRFIYTEVFKKNSFNNSNNLYNIHKKITLKLKYSYSFFYKSFNKSYF